MSDVLSRLKALSDASNADFVSRLVPNVARETILGVRTPQLRSLARDMLRDGSAEAFLSSLPHGFFDEGILHSLLLSQLKSPLNVLMEKIECFLPYMDNWAVCDQLRPKIFMKYPAEVYPAISKWLRSSHEYTRRFGIVMSMTYFLDENFNRSMLEDVAQTPSEEYYVMMAAAWYFSFALIKQWDDAIVYLEERRLNKVLHNMAIRKAVESLRVSSERKCYLRSLRWK